MAVDRRIPAHPQVLHEPNHHVQQRYRMEESAAGQSWHRDPVSPPWLNTGDEEDDPDHDRRAPIRDPAVHGLRRGAHRRRTGLDVGHLGEGLRASPAGPTRRERRPGHHLPRARASRCARDSLRRTRRVDGARRRSSQRRPDAADPARARRARARDRDRARARIHDGSTATAPNSSSSTATASADQPRATRRSNSSSSGAARPCSPRRSPPT